MMLKNKENEKMAYSNPIPELDDFLNDSNVENEYDYTQTSDVYFAFIDVLGFKKTFDDIKISKQESGADKYREVFNYYFELMNAAKFMEKGKSTGCYAGQTSDSLYFYTDRPDYLLQFIKIFSHFSLYAMSKDVFFRGGISKGTLYKKEKYQFYGDCVIGAYLLESNISKNPTIMIDENTHVDMCNIAGYSELVADFDTRHYIRPFKYLNTSVVLDVDENFELRKIDVDLIGTNISDNKKAFEYDAKNYSKYVFLLKEWETSNKQHQNGIE